MEKLLAMRSIRWKLGAAFVTVACLVAAYVGIAIAIHFALVERAAQVEAEHVAELIAESAVDDNGLRPGLQEYVARLHSLRKRDVVIVDARQKGIADVNPAEVGMTYVGDLDDEVGKTIADGQPRTFFETDADHPKGAHQLVIAVRPGATDSGKPAVGAVILEYTTIRESLLAEERANLYLIIGLGIGTVLLVTFFGLRIANRITQPLSDLKTSVWRIAAQDFAARVEVTSNDEIGILGSAFNRMAEDLSASHAELVGHKEHLEKLVSDRTQKLNQSNQLLQHAAREQKVAAERVEYLAYYDSLTTLPNRSMFSMLLNQAINLARRDGRPLAVMFIDLDRFKIINDTLGHDAGDLLLQEIGKRLKACLRESDSVARLGGDEFVILLPELHNVADAALVAHKILAATGKSFTALGQEFRVTASVGLSVFPKDGEDEQTLMKNADIAMYQAKETGKNNFQFYSVEMNRHSFERLALESKLREALEREEFQLHYQPKMNARSGSIAGMEALIRWCHPDLGTVAPAKFIPIAEEMGLIVAIGRWVLKTACAQNVAWQRMGLPPLKMGVNLSGRQFSDGDLLRDITAILAETGMNPALLELEITESLIMGDVTHSMSSLQALRAMGVSVAIDDFGTGFSTLSYLAKLPVNMLKIDRSFVGEMTATPEGLALVANFIKLAHSLKLRVVAEGVETEEQARMLRLLDCDEMQGFLFSKPVPNGMFETKYLESQVRAPEIDADHERSPEPIA